MNALDRLVQLTDQGIPTGEAIRKVRAEIAANERGQQVVPFSANASEVYARRKTQRMARASHPSPMPSNDAQDE